MKRLWAVSVCAIIFTATACKTSPSATESKAQGIWTPFAEVAGGFSPLRPLPEQTLRHAKSTILEGITKKLRRTTSAPATMAKNAAEARQQLSLVYIDTVGSVGGIPRSQGEEILTSLVTKDSVACGGVSCARVFGIDEKEVGSFMNHNLIHTYLDSSESSGSLSARIQLVLDSFKPDHGLKNVDSFVLGISQTTALPPLPVPSSRPIPIREKLSAEALRAKAGNAFVDAVAGYTLNDFHFMRQSETTTLRQATEFGLPPEAYIHNRLKADIINDGLAKLPPVSIPVYRGLNEVSRATLDRWMTKFQKGEPIGLGFEDKGGISSATWRPDIAFSFANGTDFYGYLGGFYGVFFEISHHKGISIESISRHRGEAEVIIPGTMRFKIESIQLMEKSEGIFYIKLKGL